jgi:hypothetical protein
VAKANEKHPFKLLYVLLESGDLLVSLNEQSRVEEDISMHLRLYVEHCLEREKNEMIVSRFSMLVYKECVLNLSPTAFACSSSLFSGALCRTIKNGPWTFHRLLLPCIGRAQDLPLPIAHGRLLRVKSLIYSRQGSTFPYS